MPDITMCLNTNCEKRGDCYRFRAQPNTLRQVYFAPEAEACKNFWKIEPGHRLAIVEGEKWATTTI